MQRTSGVRCRRRERRWYSVIQCQTFYGEKRLVPRERLLLRHSVYGLVRNGEHVLLVRVRSTGKYYLPGGGVERGERIEEALRREVREETGIEVEVGRFLRFHEDFFYYDPRDEAYQNLLFYYACEPRTFELAGRDEVQDEKTEDPRWVELAGLRAEDFHGHGEVIYDLLRSVVAGGQEGKGATGGEAGAIEEGEHAPD